MAHLKIIYSLFSLCWSRKGAPNSFSYLCNKIKGATKTSYKRMDIGMDTVRRSISKCKSDRSDISKSRSLLSSWTRISTTYNKTCPSYRYVMNYKMHRSIEATYSQLIMLYDSNLLSMKQFDRKLLKWKVFLIFRKFNDRNNKIK